MELMVLAAMLRALNNVQVETCCGFPYQENSSSERDQGVCASRYSTATGTRPRSEHYKDGDYDRGDYDRGDYGRRDYDHGGYRSLLFEQASPPLQIVGMAETDTFCIFLGRVWKMKSSDQVSEVLHRELGKLQHPDEKHAPDRSSLG